MAIFSELGKKISQTTQSAVKGTKDFADITRLNSQISDEQKQITNYYAQIGMRYYELHAAAPEDEVFAGFCTSIAGCVEKIAVLQAEIQKIKGIKKCLGCGAEVPIASVFCGICGHDTRKDAEAEAGVEVAVSNAPLCPGCNKEIEPGTAFCTGCGGKL